MTASCSPGTGRTAFPGTSRTSAVSVTYSHLAEGYQEVPLRCAKAFTEAGGAVHFGETLTRFDRRGACRRHRGRRVRHRRRRRGDDASRPPPHPRHAAAGARTDRAGRQGDGSREQAGPPAHRGGDADPAVQARAVLLVPVVGDPAAGRRGRQRREDHREGRIDHRPTDPPAVLLGQGRGDRKRGGPDLRRRTRAVVLAGPAPALGSLPRARGRPADGRPAGMGRLSGAQTDGRGDPPPASGDPWRRRPAGHSRAPRRRVHGLGRRSLWRRRQLLARRRSQSRGEP